MRIHMMGLTIDVLRRNREAAAINYRLAREFTWERNKVATRRYYDQWTFEQRPTGAIVYNNAAHATVIETGRAAGTYPPPNRIEDWMRAKASMSGSGLVTWRGWRRRQLVFLISRAIFEHGTPADTIMQDSFTEARRQYERFLVHSLIHFSARRGIPVRVRHTSGFGTMWNPEFLRALRYTDSMGRVQIAFPDGPFGDPARLFETAWTDFRDIASRLPGYPGGVTPPPGPAPATGEYPGRDY